MWLVLQEVSGMKARPLHPPAGRYTLKGSLRLGGNWLGYVETFQITTTSSDTIPNIFKHFRTKKKRQKRVTLP